MGRGAIAADAISRIFEVLGDQFGYMGKKRDARAAEDRDRADRETQRQQRLADDRTMLADRDRVNDANRDEARTYAETQRTKQEGEDRVARGGDFFNLLRRTAQLPDRNKKAYFNSGGKMALKPDDYLSDEDLSARQAADTAAKTAQIEGEAFAREKGNRRAAQAYPTPVQPRGPQGDDPTLPLGVRRYLAEIANRHQLNPDAARAELTNAMQSLYNDHPHLDANKAVTELARLTGAKPKEDDGAYMYGQPGAAAAMRGAPPAPAPAQGPPVTPAAPMMPPAQRAETLLQQLGTTTDPAARARIKAELATIQRQLRGVVNKF